MAEIHNEKTYALKIRESADNGSDFGTPDADYRFLFLGEDGDLHLKDSSDTVTDIESAAAHIADTSDAHDASAISVADSGGNFTGTDVEAVLAELQDNIDGVSPGGSGALFPLIGDPPSFAGGGDTDFRGAANLGNYTAVGSDGASTIALRTTTTTTNVYQLTGAGLLIQCGHGEIQEFRADYTLPDNQSIIMAGSFAPRRGVGDNAAFALRLNNSNTSSTTSDFVSVMIEQDGTTEYCIQGNSSADAAGFEIDTPQWWTPPLFLFRIARDNLTYRSWVSLNGGATWTYVDTETFGSALTDVWISVLGGSTGQVHMPVACVPFIVEGHGDDAFHPW